MVKFKSPVKVKYPYVMAYAKWMQSKPHYIEDLLRKAEEEGAPLDAYRRDDYSTDEEGKANWLKLADMPNKALQAQIFRDAQKYRENN